MPPPLGPHDVSPPTPVPVAPHDALQDTPPPPAPHDAAQGHGPGLCNCCGSEGCETFLASCPTWPPPAVEFNLSAITTGTLPGSDYETYCAFWNAKFSSPGIAGCWDRAFTVPLWCFNDAGGSQTCNHGIDACGWYVPLAARCEAEYTYCCTGTVPGIGDYKVALYIVFAPTIIDGRFSFLVVLHTAMLVDGISVFGPDIIYRAQYVGDEFPCNGPWVLARQGGAEAGCTVGWPDTITVGVADGGGSLEENCCDLQGARYSCVDGVCVATEGGTYATLAECQAPGACDVEESYDCDPLIGCTDPGDGTGFYTGLTAHDDCVAACIPSKWACVGGVCQRAFGGAFANEEDCVVSGCEGGGDEPIGDDSCCPPESPPPGVMSLVTTCPAAACLDAIVTSAAWLSTLKAFVTTVPACGTFITFYLFCVGGAIQVAMQCTGSPIIYADHIALEDGSGLCGPGAFVHAVATFPGAGPCAGLPPGSALTVGLGYDSAGGGA